MNNRNNAPWNGPTAFTREGYWKKYLAGTATNTRNKREIPSEKARRRSLPVAVDKSLIIIRMF